MRKKSKTLEEKGYRAIAVRDECFFGSENSKDAVIVIIRYAKEGKKNMLYKDDAKEFPNADYLHKFIKEKKIKVIPEKDFRAEKMAEIMQLIKAKSN